MFGAGSGRNLRRLGLRSSSLQMFPPFQNGVKEKEKTSYMYLHVGFGPSIHENIFPEEHWILISGFVFVKMLL